MNYGVPINEYKNKKIGLYGGKFLPFHKGHLNCIFEAQSLVDILFVVVGYDDVYDKSLCENTGFEWVSSRVRERWITKELKNFKNIRVLSQYEKRSDDYMNDDSIFDSHKELLSKIGGKVDVVFSSEPEYEEYFAKYLPQAKHHIIDTERSAFNISATEIRKNGIFHSWNFLPPAVREHYVKRIAICGIESVGKSHLTKMLAKHFETNHLEEYGRLYYDEINGYADISEPSDYADIAAGHVHLMNEASKKSNKVLMVDTDLVYTQFFHFMETGEYHELVDTMLNLKVEKIDEYIFIEPHNFHELDGTRRPVTDVERQKRNNLLKSIYEMYGIKLKIVDEVERNKRFNQCKEIVRSSITGHS